MCFSAEGGHTFKLVVFMRFSGLQSGIEDTDGLEENIEELVY